MMKKYARIENGIVAELFSTSGDIAKEFHPDLVWLDCSTVTAIADGWLYVNGVFLAPITPTPIIYPSADGFIQSIKTELGGIVAIADSQLPYSALVFAVQFRAWADVQALILDARSKTLLTDDQYAAFKTAATNNNIPITL